QDLPATSIAWGLWADTSTMTSHLNDTDIHRMTRAGMPPLATDEGLALFDTALTTNTPLLVALNLDTAAVRTSGLDVPPLLRGLVRAPLRRAVGVSAGQVEPSLGRRLAGLAETDRAAAAVEEVQTLVAAVLGHSSTGTVGIDRPFKELGFDSLMAVELRNRLNALTGLRLPVTLAFDHPTPVALAEHVLAQLTASGMVTDAGRQAAATAVAGTGGAANAGTATGVAGVPPVDDQTLTTLYRQINRLGELEASGNLLAAAALVRPSFKGRGDVDRLPRFTRLSTGPERPEILCFPPFVPVPGNLQFASFSAALDGLRGVSVIPTTGFAAGERIPDNLDATVDIHADAVAARASGHPVVLMGYSSGGLLAHAVATALEERMDVPVAAVVLLDTYMPGSLARPLARALYHEVFEKREGFATVDYSSLTAMTRYLDVFGGWGPRKIEAPTLIVRPEDCVPLLPGETMEGADWRGWWHLPHTGLKVPGDHCTMMTDHGAATGRAVHEWILDTL
ncbi:thioesterase domain-containing protein, partial [Kitasatospora sp. NPDC090091]|uniref:thioesterase domain-containing protein n=1 Tax=Kitasatospora sp. NPDC090091 TaxID=3364081 RepID=UPI0037FD2411